MTDEHTEAGPGYAFARLLRAIKTATTHPDEATRARALDKADAWRRVVEGMASGVLSVGSRTPVADTPAWVTLEVAHGGFATGRFTAESALAEHEVAKLAELPADAPGATDRERLNLYYLSDAGQAELVEAVARGTYRVDVPEEGALPTVAWLMERGHEAEALRLVATLRPLLHRLRFYPRPHPSPYAPSALAHVATAGEVAAQLRSATAHPQVVAMNEALLVWNPLFDRLLAMWLATVEGEPPDLARDDAGELRCGPDEQPIVIGGWPCQRWPSGWSRERDAWLADYQAAAREHRHARKHAHPKSNFGVLRRALEACPDDGAALSPRDAGRVRHALAGAVARHGLPDTAKHRALRERQAADAARPLYATLAHVVAARLDQAAPDEGVAAFAPIVEPVADGETHHAPAGAPIPEPIQRKAARALAAPIDELIRRDVVRSSDALALLVPQLTAGVAATAIADEPARGLFAQTYAAFRRRRSLLLLNLDHQVQLEELPWIGALAPLRTGLSDAGRAREVLTDVVRHALYGFPHTLTPNRLVRELTALSQAAGLDLPLVEEVAADIFMGRFAAKWTEAATVASRVLQGTLYARYYDLPETYAARWVWQKVDERFAAVCAERAAEAGTGGSAIARNGAVLEQSQILTTHNLAVLLDGLALTEEVRDRAPDLAAYALGWATRTATRRAVNLRALKNAAYAWRQGILFLSLLEPAEQKRIVMTVRAGLPYEHPLHLAFDGLLAVQRGARFDRHGALDDGGRRFLGWSAGRHWLLAAQAGG